MATDSTVKFKADISQLKAEMQAASRAVKLASSEFKAATAGMDDWSKSADGLDAKIKQLNKQLDAQKKKVEIANKELEATVKLYGEDSAEADRARISLNNYISAMTKTEKELKDYESDLEDCVNGTGKFADEVDEASLAAEDASGSFSVMKGALADLVADGIRMAVSALKDLATETLTVGSNFEHAMSQVAAVSGASGDDLDRLTEKAKEMGESTIFSATQSAEAFNYMAMAGWKTEDMLSGIEGIMNLAAASGTDLATTSDIVTDALTGMGYGAEDAGRLADVMAAASSNANTNVEMMGQTFQYVAPLIGSLGMNMEDAAVAIGLMANSGIKGTKSGTALRSMLSRLAAPPDKCAKSMFALGISITDSEGRMKSLDEIMRDLRSGFSGLTEEEQAFHAKNIAGQEAMSGLLAIVNATESDFNKLTDAVNNSSGASKKMADIMNDNVQGSLTLLKSNIEGKMIKVYDSAKDSIKKALNGISDALNKIDWDKVGSKIWKGVEHFVNLFFKIIKHGNEIITVLKAIGTVLISTFVATKLLTFVSSIMKAVQVFKTLKVAVEGATAAQKLFNIAQAASPVGVAVAAVAGLAAGLLVLAGNSKEAAEATNNLTEAENEQISKVHEMAEAYAEVKARRDESVQGIQSEFDYYKSLADELESLIGANGKVKEGYEERAHVITTTLNEALGTEIKMTEGVIQNYKNVIDTIDQVIEKKKAEAILNANQEAYTEAIQHQQEALKEYLETQDLYNTKVRERNEAEKALNEIQEMSVEEYAKLNGYGRDYAYAAEKMGEAEGKLRAEFAEANRGVYEARNAFREAEGTYTGYMATIKNYEGLSAAIIKGDADQISESLANMQNDFIDAETGTKESLERQAQAMAKNYEDMAEAVKKNAPGVTKEMVNQAKEMSKKATDELAKYNKKYAEKGKANVNSYIQSFGEGKYGAQKAGEEVATSSNTGLDTGKAGAKTSGEGTGGAYASGVSSKASDSYSAGQGVASQASAGLASGGDKSYTSGQNFTQGYINGIASKLKEVFNVGYNTGKKATDGVKEGQKEGSPSKITFKSGVNFIKGYLNGMLSEDDELKKTVSNIVGSALTQLVDSEDAKKIKQSVDNFTKEISDSVSSQKIGASLDFSSDMATARGVSQTIVNDRVSQPAKDSVVYYNFTQNNTSPKPLSRLDIYRQTKNQFSNAQMVMGV